MINSIHNTANQIRVSIQTSCKFDYGFKEYAMDALNEFQYKLLAKHYDIALDTIVELSDAMIQVDSIEYRNVYKTHFNFITKTTEELL